MPSYRKTSKYSVEKTQELRVFALDVLLTAKKPLTISEICAADMNLVGQTNQKMARVLAELNEAGFVRKTMSKEKKRMIYVAVACLEDQGYDMENFVC